MLDDNHPYRAFFDPGLGDRTIIESLLAADKGHLIKAEAYLLSSNHWFEAFTRAGPELARAELQKILANISKSDFENALETLNLKELEIQDEVIPLLGASVTFDKHPCKATLPDKREEFAAFAAAEMVSPECRLHMEIEMLKKRRLEEYELKRTLRQMLRQSEDSVPSIYMDTEREILETPDVAFDIAKRGEAARNHTLFNPRWRDLEKRKVIPQPHSIREKGRPLPLKPRVLIGDENVFVSDATGGAAGVKAPQSRQNLLQSPLLHLRAHREQSRKNPQQEPQPWPTYVIVIVAGTGICLAILAVSIPSYLIWSRQREEVGGAM